MSKKYFTLAEANALLPSIRKELEILQSIKREFERKYMELRTLKEQYAYGSETKDADLFFTLECEIEFMQIEARGHIQHLYSQGVELKDIEIGLVDFPAVLNGEEVLLCWRQGEERITHYHNRYEGYAGRKPIEE
jgi:hypothetical protein